MQPRNYYIDMDGVLVIYNYDGYRGEHPLFLQKGKHYFRDLQPDHRMLQITDGLIAQSRYTGDNVYILTTIAMNGAIFNEQFHDKIVWLNKWVPNIDIDHILISVTSKRDTVEYIHNHILTKNDIAIDDYNKNLFEWENANGTAVKYCNGINSPDSFNGIKILPNDTAEEALKKLLAIRIN